MGHLEILALAVGLLASLIDILASLDLFFVDVDDAVVATPETQL